MPKQDVDNVKFFSRSIVGKDIENAVITISGLDLNRGYTIEAQTVGYKSGDVYDAYLQCADKALEKRETVNMLKSFTLPKKTIIEQTSDDEGTLRITIPQSENCAILIKIYQI